MMSYFSTVSALKDMQGVLHTWLDQIFLSFASKSLMYMCGVGQGFSQHTDPLLRNAVKNLLPCPLGMGMNPSAA